MVITLSVIASRLAIVIVQIVVTVVKIAAISVVIFRIIFIVHGRDLDAFASQGNYRYDSPH
jgi:hypothetical protein